MVEREVPRRQVVDAVSRPALPRHVKLRHDKERDRWVLLAPERVLTPDDIAIEVLKLCDGTRSVESIAAALSKAYDAPENQICADVIELLQDLADRGYVRA